MNLYDKLLNRDEKMSIIGLGYVGMPIAVAFAKKVDVLGFDISKSKISEYKAGIDPTNEVGDEAIQGTAVDFTADASRIQEAKFHVVAVPTPITHDNIPDLTPLKAASKTVGENLTEGSIVVYESTVYPGVTEEVCIPILEEASGLEHGKDFKVGFSPERINPGDKVNTLETIVKVVSGSDEEALDIIAKTYELVVDAGVHRASTIKVAEAAKVIENAQRDINIAFMNELSIIFNMMDIDTREVLDAAETKWNFKKFSPGLVGGHCIGVDPYYLTHKAEQLGYHPEVVLSGRRINDGMGKYVAENVVKQLIDADINIKHAKVAILGFTFKENVPDIRNTRTIDIINELEDYGIAPLIHDPQADYDEALEEYGLQFKKYDEIKDVDAVILTVGHEEYKQLTKADIDKLYGTNGTKKVMVDVKGILNRQEMSTDYNYWRL